MIHRLIFLFQGLLILLLLLQPFIVEAGYKRGVGTRWKGHLIGSTFDLDFSKTYISGYFDFAEKRLSLTDLNERTSLQDEMLFYLRQFQTTLQPQYFLVEGDLYPMTTLGSYLYRKKDNFYHNFDIHMNQISTNLIELGATRYETPYSLSFFVGNILQLTDPNEKEKKQAGSAVMGHVITIGNRSLIRLRTEENRWIEYAYKIKGQNNTEFSQTQWKFQVGYTYNDNNRFFQAIVFNIGRDRSSTLDSSLLANLKIEYNFNIPTEKVKSNNSLKKLTSFQKIVVGRNFHFKDFILKMDFGMKWELFKERGDQTFSETTVIMAPNITW